MIVCTSLSCCIPKFWRLRCEPQISIHEAPQMPSSQFLCKGCSSCDSPPCGLRLPAVVPVRSSLMRPLHFLSGPWLSNKNLLVTVDQVLSPCNPSTENPQSLLQRDTGASSLKLPNNNSTVGAFFLYVERGLGGGSFYNYVL